MSLVCCVISVLEFVLVMRPRAVGDIPGIGWAKKAENVKQNKMIIYNNIYMYTVYIYMHIYSLFSYIYNVFYNYQLVIGKTISMYL